MATRLTNRSLSPCWRCGPWLGTLLVAIEAPAPVPQTKTSRSAITLVWGGQMITRSLLPRGPADWGMQSLFLAPGWFAVLGTYQQVLWLHADALLQDRGHAWMTWTVLVRTGDLSGRRSRTRSGSPRLS